MGQRKGLCRFAIIIFLSIFILNSAAIYIINVREYKGTAVSIYKYQAQWEVVVNLPRGRTKKFVCWSKEVIEKIVIGEEYIFIVEKDLLLQVARQ